jgi:hypothetical protein
VKWLGIDSERLAQMSTRLDRLAGAIGSIGSLNDEHGDRMRDEARALATEAVVTARRVLVEFADGSLSARRFDEWGGEFAGWWVERHIFPTTEADRVVRELLENPEMAGVFVDRLTRPEALVHGVNDIDALRRLWTLVTDPATVPVDVAVSRIRTLLLGLFAETYWENVPATRIEDPTMKTRNAMMLAALAPIVALWQLNLPGMLGEIGDSSEEGRVFLQLIMSREALASEMRAHLPEAFDRTLESMPEDRFEQDMFFGALGYSVGAIISGMQSWTKEELAFNLQLLREVGNLISLVPSPYYATSIPSAAITLLAPSEVDDSDLTDEELLELHDLRVELANAASNHYLEHEIRAGRHVRGSTDYSLDLLSRMLHIRWAIDSPVERGRVWRELDDYYEFELIERAVVENPSQWLEIIDRDHFVEPDDAVAGRTYEDFQNPFAAFGEPDPTDEVVGAYPEDLDVDWTPSVPGARDPHLERLDPLQGSAGR